MKIKFNDSKLEKGNIKVSLDGGFTYNDFDIQEVRNSGIELNDSQDFGKIMIKGPANVLRNLNVLSKLYVDGIEGPNNSGGNDIGFLCFRDNSTPVVELNDGGVAIIPN